MELLQPRLPDRKHFVDIGSVQRCREAIQYAQSFGEPVRIVSDAGYGKTTALYYLSHEFDGVYCQVGQAHKSTADMYRLLLAAFGIWHDFNYMRDLSSKLISALTSYSSRRTLLIVDEVQTLEATAQRELLNIQETCDIALIVSGNGDRIARSKIDYGAWKQIDSRIGMEIMLPGLSRKDCQLMGAAYGVEGLDAYNAIVNYGTKTTPRMLGRLLRNAKELTADSTAIQLKQIEATLAGNPKLGDTRLLRPDKV